MTMLFRDLVEELADFLLPLTGLLVRVEVLADVVEDFEDAVPAEVLELLPVLLHEPLDGDEHFVGHDQRVTPQPRPQPEDVAREGKGEGREGRTGGS